MIKLRCLRIGALALVLGAFLLMETDGRALSGEPERPTIHKLGTLDLDMVETTPVMKQTATVVSWNHEVLRIVDSVQQ